MVSLANKIVPARTTNDNYGSAVRSMRYSPLYDWTWTSSHIVEFKSTWYMGNDGTYSGGQSYQKFREQRPAFY